MVLIMSNQKVAIMGSGPGGSYLYSLLRKKKPEIETSIFDIPADNICGIKGCAWGLNYSLFSGLCQNIGLITERYVLRKCDHVFLEDVKIDADIAVIDKPLFIHDMLSGEIPRNPLDANTETYDRIIDATGYKRAYLSSFPASRLLSTVQYRTIIPSVSVPHVFINDKSGYAWIFPLNEGEVHIGAGSLDGIQEAMREVDKLCEQYKAGAILCSCQENLWHDGPVSPVTEGKIWGLGESIGLVNPVSGAGIIPAMISAQLMLENWDDPQKYELSIWKRYSYMIKEHDIAVKMVNKKLNIIELLNEIGTLRAMSRDAGIAPQLSKIKEYSRIKGLFYQV